MSQQLLLFINILTPILKHFTNIELTKPLQETIHECIMHRILSNQQDEYNIYIYSDDHIVLQRADGTFMSSKRNFNVSIEYYTILRNHILNLYAFEDSHRCNDKVINICKDINDENFNTLCDYSVIDRRLNRCKLMNFEYQIGDLLFEICRLENDEVDVLFENDFVTIYKFDDNFVEENSIDREMFDRKIEQRDEKNIVENLIIEEIFDIKTKEEQDLIKGKDNKVKDENLINDGKKLFESEEGEKMFNLNLEEEKKDKNFKEEILLNGIQESEIEEEIVKTDMIEKLQDKEIKDEFKCEEKRDENNIKK